MKAKKTIKCVDEFTYKLVNRKPFKKSFTSNLTGKLSLLSKFLVIHFRASSARLNMQIPNDIA